MLSKTAQRILGVADQLIVEGNELMKTEWEHYADRYVSVQGISKWRGGCRNLIRMIGRGADPWREVFDAPGNRSVVAQDMQGSLQSLRDAVAADLLVTVEDFVFAEAFADLLE